MAKAPLLFGVFAALWLPLHPSSSRAGDRLLGIHRCGSGCHHQPPLPPPAPPPPTLFQASDDPENLQVQVVGERFDTLELFFKNNLHRETIAGAYYLQCYGSLLLAPENPYGTVAVRYGQHHDHLQVFAWDKDATAIRKTGPIVLEPGYPVYLRWVTPRVLKVNFGPRGDREYILRYTDADNPWTVLYSDLPTPPRSGERERREVSS